MKTLAEFISRKDGTVAVLFALTSTIGFGVVGGAVDYARGLHARTTTSAALDAAVLAGARVLQLGGDEASARAATQSYFDVHKSKWIRDTPLDIDVRHGTQVVASTATSVDTVLLRLFNIPSMNFELTSGAEMAGGAGALGNLEVALMLDVTESMCDNADGPCTQSVKLDALKQAATDLVNRVVWEDQSTYTSRVAVVPFAGRVRVARNGEGGELMTRLTNLPATWSGWRRRCTNRTGGGGGGNGGNSEEPSSGGGGGGTCQNWVTNRVNNWKIRPCVTERTHVEAFTDAAPGSNAWLNGHDGGRRPFWADSREVPDVTGNTQNNPLKSSNYNDKGTCSESNNANALIPLTSNKAVLTTAINNLVAFGSTGGTLGTAMTWYTLSPNFASVWPAASAPAPYEDTQSANGELPKLRKVAVLMTDGEFNTERGRKGRDAQDMANKTKTMCAAMKQQGIEIYTVGLALNELTPADEAIATDMLQTCGSSLDHFYNTLDIDELQTAFRSISLQMSAVRIFAPDP